MTSDIWRVIKLGGTSQCKKGYDELIKQLSAHPDHHFVIVLSAISGVTDLLEKYTHTKDNGYIIDIYEKESELRSKLEIDQVIWENYCNTREFLDATDDNILYEQSRMIGSGEMRSTSILYEYLQKMMPDEKITLVSSYDFIKSKKETFKLYPTTQFNGNLEKFKDAVGDNRIVICQGFIASTPLNKTILLGRGGSDTTGALIANMLNADEYQVWTDVSGIFSCDPRIVDNPKKLTIIDYDLVVEIAEMGAKVMHPFSILPCAIKNIPIKVKNTFNLEAGETIIKKVKYEKTEQPIVIAVQKKVTLFKIASLDMWNSYGFMHDIFRRFASDKIDVNIVTTSPSSVYTTTDETNISVLKSIECDLSEMYDVEMITDCSVVTIVSPDIRTYLNIIDLTAYPAHIIHIGANFMSINFVVDTDHAGSMVISYYNALVE